MKRSSLKYKSAVPGILLMLVFSCGGHREMIIINRIPENSGIQNYSLTDNDIAKPKKNGKSRNGDYRIHTVKYLSYCSYFTPAYKIIDAGINEALAGNYAESEILFREAIPHVKDGSAQNNLGIIFEVTGKKKEAAEMYLNAMLQSPENIHYRNNFASFINFKLIDYNKRKYR